MATNTAPKRSRASPEQLSLMTGFMLENDGLAGGKFLKMHGKLANGKKWGELATLLNSVGGTVKTVDQWRTVWRDLKTRTSNKVRDRKKQQALTGNRPVYAEPTTELEKRVVGLIGNQYIEGDESVIENVPLEEEFQLRMEEEDESVFAEIPSSSSVFQMEVLTPKTPLKITPRRSRKRMRLEEESESTKQFLEIAKQQADSLKLLAEASAATPETNRIMAEAIKSMGEGMKAMAEGLHRLADSIDRL